MSTDLALYEEIQALLRARNFSGTVVYCRWSGPGSGTHRIGMFSQEATTVQILAGIGAIRTAASTAAVEFAAEQGVPEQAVMELAFPELAAIKSEKSTD